MAEQPHNGAPDSPEGSLKPNAGPKGRAHRRVKSLVKELEDQTQATELPTSPSSPTSSSSAQNSLTARPSSQSLRSISSSSREATPDLSSPSRSRTVSSHSARSRISSNASDSAPAISLSKSQPVSTKTTDDDAAEAAEAEDVFLPLSPASPYDFKFAPSTPTTPTSPATSTKGMNAFEKREHSRKHSRIHSRNLSVFFPKPGSEAASELQAVQGPSPSVTSPGFSPVSIPGANVRAYATEGAGGESHVYRQQNQLGHGKMGVSPTSAGPSARRGHHHRHSVSHNFYESPLSASPDVSHASTPLSATAPKVASHLSLATPTSLPSGSSSSSLRNKYGHLPVFIRLCLVLVFHIPLRAQLALCLASSELIIGALLWVYGQSGESLAVTGLGYLVVFDSLGAFSNILIEQRQHVEGVYDVLSSATTDHLRHPFGTHRLTTLSHFAQAIYLLFSGVYVCKESIEHVLLLHEPVDEASGAGGHGSAHGSMGHGQGQGATPVESDWVEIWIAMPTGLLFISVLIGLTTAFFLENHRSMTEAVGPSTYALRARSTSNKSLSLLSNPFSLLVLFFSSILALASFTISAVQLAPLDKVLALLEPIAMFYVAYPAAEATGKVLLQVAPPKEAPAMKALYKGIKDIEGHPSVMLVPRPHVWQLTPHPREDQQPSDTSFARRSTTRDIYSSAHCILIANLKIHLKPDVSDQEMLAVTTYARERCGGAFKGGVDGDTSIGELNVVCIKGLQEEFLSDHHHHDHGHAHTHAAHGECSGHGHTHDHGDSHAHHHHHHHSHPHGHSHAH